MKDLGFQNLGFINVAIIYLSFSFASMLAVKIQKALGTRLTLTVSALAYTFWIACFLFPAYKFEEGTDNDSGVYDPNVIKILSIVSSAIIGIGAGPLWVSQSYYITECASNTNKGLYNSIFFATFQSAHILTYPITGVLIGNFSKITFYWIMTAISFVGSIFFMVLTDPVNAEELLKHSEEKSEEIQ